MFLGVMFGVWHVWLGGPFFFVRSGFAKTVVERNLVQKRLLFLCC